MISSVAGFGIGFMVFNPQMSSLQGELLQARSEISSLQREKVSLEGNLSSLASEYGRLNQTYFELKTSYSNLYNNYSSLQNSYQALSSNYDRLNADYNKLKTNYTSLESDYSALLWNCSQLIADIDQLRLLFDQLQLTYSSTAAASGQMMSYYMGLSSDVLRLDDLLDSYRSIPDAFPRVLNDGAIKKTATAVAAAGTSSSDIWSSEQKIYDYITANIKYASDIEMPYMSTYRYVTYEGNEYVTGFYDEIKTVQNYVQTPELTLEIKQGDCDDQAVLAYAMIKYHMKYVYGTEYNLYLASIDFSGGSGHLSVILPVQGGELCIIDPTGNYLTKSGGVITSKAALSELQAYSDYWSSDAGSITHMVLYKVNVVDGSYTVFTSGTISQVAAAFT